MKSNKNTVLLLIASTLPIVSGCSILHTESMLLHHRGEKQVQVEKVLAQVTVGGVVHEPGRFTIDQQNLTLCDAINLAGGIRENTGGLRNYSAADHLWQRLDAVDEMHRGLSDKFAELQACFNEYESLLKKKKPVQPLLKEMREASLEEKTKAFLGILSDVNYKSSKIRKLAEEEHFKDIDLPLFELLIAEEKFWKDEYKSLKNISKDTIVSIKQRLKGFQNKLSASERRLRQVKTTIPIVATSNESAGSYFVSLRRDATSPRVSYYLIYEQVMGGGIGGGIRLQDGDFVSVVPMNDTSLARTSTSGSNLTGNTTVTTLRNFVNKNDQTNRFSDKGQLTTVLIRESGDLRGKDVYLLPFPLSNNPSTSQGFGDIRLLESDRLNITPTVVAPLIADTVVGSVVADVLAERTRIAKPNFDQTNTALSRIGRAHELSVRNVSTAFNRLIGF